jgi:ABC-type transport system involved in multi-copper enzyme maturation permease subunit
VAEAANLITKLLPKMFQQLLPLPVEMMTSLEGRIAFSYEELPVILLMALWSVGRGTECIAGRLGDGTMEMLLAQPVRRVAIVASHSGVSLVGVMVVAGCSWVAVYLALGVIEFEVPAPAATYLPAMANLLALGVCLLGISTLASALTASRGRAVGIVIGFYIAELTCKIVALMLNKHDWLHKLTFLSAYEPTFLTVGLHTNPDQYWPLFWQYNGALAAIGLVAWSIATTIFCHRDVPAPV